MKLRKEIRGLLEDARQALINRDAVRCYDSNDDPCGCTICKIDRVIKNKTNGRKTTTKRKSERVV